MLRAGKRLTVVVLLGATQGCRSTSAPSVKTPPITVEASMIAATSPAKTLPFDAYRTGGTWVPDENARFVKLHLYADAPFPLQSIELVNCERLYSDGAAFVNFDEARLPLTSSTASVLTLSAPIAARSLTINFGDHRACPVSLKLFGPGHSPISVITPRLVSGKARASSTLAPESAYDVSNLFDSRYENAWASNHQSTGVSLAFDFDQPQRVEKLRLWNGYQRSDQHCWSNSRVKTFTVSGDGGYSATLSVADRMGSQELQLPSAFVGRHLSLTATEAYPGRPTRISSSASFASTTARAGSCSIRLRRWRRRPSAIARLSRTRECRSSSIGVSPQTPTATPAMTPT